ncbi:hypothetical protein V6Z12_A10G154000 [Gossypium hirsutum]
MGLILVVMVYFCKRPMLIWASTAAPLCLLSCNENRAKTFKEDQICPVWLSFVLPWCFSFQVILFQSTVSCCFDPLHRNFRDMPCSFNLLQRNFKDMRFGASICFTVTLER